MTWGPCIEKSHLGSGESHCNRAARRIFQQNRVAHVDVSLSGDVIGAEQGTLSVMATGDRQPVDTVEPFCGLGRNVFVGARPGMAKP
jgi:3-hydroxyisobutyrate dehydrogenase-like beta-hydroxyacid dehydrogenase